MSEVADLEPLAAGPGEGHGGEPGEALRVIAERQLAAGFHVRTHYRCGSLTEICVTNPADPERGSMSINRDGFMTWERTASIADSKGVSEISDVMAVLLSAREGSTRK